MNAASLTSALTHIHAHLDGDLSIRHLAKIAGCSPPYFARRFAALMRETPALYVSRLRLERAALWLVLLDCPIQDVATACGYARPETFCRAFRAHFGLSPREFRESGRLPRASKTVRPDRETTPGSHPPASLSSTLVRTLQPMSLAFIRHTGPYEQVPESMWDTLLSWARARRIPPPHLLLGIALDAPGITPPDRLRFDAAIRVPTPFSGTRRIAHQHFPGGVFALTTSVGPLCTLPGAYAEIFARLCRDRTIEVVGLPCVEFYRADRVRTDLSIIHTDIAVPVRRTR